jgi:hypothetical protein
LARYDYVLIDAGSQDRQRVESVLARVFGGAFETVRGQPETGWEERHLRLSDTASLWLDGPEGRDGELAGFTFDAQIQDRGADTETGDFQVQERTARRVFDALADATDWRLALCLDDFGPAPLINERQRPDLRGRAAPRWRADGGAQPGRRTGHRDRIGRDGQP